MHTKNKSSSDDAKLLLNTAATKLSAKQEAITMIEKQISKRSGMY